jgi:hypothetical protein
MESEAKAPAGGGDTKSWFHFYKWDTEGEVFVPRKRPFYDASPGDYLWFFMNSQLLGGTHILRVELEESQGIQEIWYDAGQRLVVTDGPYILTSTVPEVTQARGEAWLAAATQK